MKGADGNYYEILSTPLTNPDGTIDKVIEVVLDITERKKAEQESIRQKEMIEMYLNLAGVIFVAIDRKGYVTLINKKGCDLLGYDQKEIIGKNWFDNFLPERLRKDVISVSEQILNGDIEPLEFYENPILTKAGEEKLIAWHNTALKDDGGNIIGHLSSGEDITERKKDEEVVKNLQSQLSNAIEMAHLGPWEYDVATDTFTFNDYFYKIFRTTAAEVGGYKMKPDEYAGRFLHPDDIPRVRDETIKALETKDPNYKTRTEHRIIYPDGTIGWVSVQIFIIKDNSGNTIKTYGVNQDITELKRLEDEFLKSQKMESISILAGGIAHDFNNILAAIIGNVNLAKDQVDTKTETYELLSEAETSSKRAQALTRQLLTFAKGGMPVKKIVGIKDIIKESCLFVTRGSRCRCEFSIPEDLYTAEVDEGQINQVINNIVINANQAMPEGGIIHVNAENMEIDEANSWKIKPGKYIRIALKDEGIGIPEKHLSKIFDPYFSTKQEGSGLGLASSYSIIKNHGGHITVESDMGTGTTFHLYIPASGKKIPEKEEYKIIKGEGRVLVMDDEKPLSKMLKRMLEKLGYEADLTEDGVEAIEIYKASKESGNPYDAVILDLTVPGGLGGKETINKLLKIDPEVKAIVSSGYSDDPVLANYQEYGFKGIILKPFVSSLLSKVLHEVLK